MINEKLNIENVCKEKTDHLKRSDMSVNSTFYCLSPAAELYKVSYDSIKFIYKLLCHIMSLNQESDEWPTIVSRKDIKDFLMRENFQFKKLLDENLLQFFDVENYVLTKKTLKIFKFAAKIEKELSGCGIKFYHKY